MGIGSFAPQAVQRADTAFAARLQARVAADMPSTAVAPARVRLQLRDGREWTRERWQMKGSPQEPMSEAEVGAKFRACVASGFGAPAAAVDRLHTLVLSLDTLPDAGELLQAFAALR